jgi:hypothetical protein
MADGDSPFRVVLAGVRSMVVTVLEAEMLIAARSEASAVGVIPIRTLR